MTFVRDWLGAKGERVLENHKCAEADKAKVDTNI